MFPLSLGHRIRLTKNTFVIFCCEVNELMVFWWASDFLTFPRSWPRCCFDLFSVTALLHFKSCICDVHPCGWRIARWSQVIKWSQVISSCSALGRNLKPMGVWKRGGHGLPKVSLGPAMPTPSTPCGRDTPETAAGWVFYPTPYACAETWMANLKFSQGLPNPFTLWEHCLLLGGRWLTMK
jgi:hypothetical protein